MSKNKKRKKSPVTPAHRNTKLKDALSGINLRLLAVLLGSGLLSCVLFFLGAYSSHYKFTYILWFVLLSGFVIAYVIINRGFTERGLTVEMLPDTMTEEEKRAYVEKSSRREQKTKWMLVVIAALSLPLMIDLFRLFVWDRFVGN